MWRPSMCRISECGHRLTNCSCLWSRQPPTQCTTWLYSQQMAMFTSMRLEWPEWFASGCDIHFRCLHVIRSNYQFRLFHRFCGHRQILISTTLRSHCRLVIRLNRILACAHSVCNIICEVVSLFMYWIQLWALTSTVWQDQCWMASFYSSLGLVLLNGYCLCIWWSWCRWLDQGFWPDGIYTAPSDAALLRCAFALQDFRENHIIAAIWPPSWHSGWTWFASIRRLSHHAGITGRTSSESLSSKIWSSITFDFCFVSLMTLER